MNKKIIWLAILALAILAVPLSPVAAATKKTAKVLPESELLGRFLIQKESLGQLWYTEPISKKRYTVRDLADLNWIKDKLAVEISQKDLNNLASKKGKKSNSQVLKKYRGKLVFLKDKKSYWYVNPGDNIRYPVSGYSDFARMARVIGLQVDDKTLRRLAMNDEQFTFDSAFPQVAYVKYDGQSFSGGVYSKTILPLASLSKLMTALVFLDQNPDWEKTVTITNEEINYPYTLAAKGTTSEVDLQAGDKVKINDLWSALLTASSNQSAVILADNSGLSRQEFVSKMNDKAKELGLKKTSFKEMSGLDANNISTAEEFAVLAKEAFSKEKIIEGTRCLDCIFTVEAADGSTRDVSVKNRNLSLLAFEPEAVKTGFLVEAQRNVALKKEDKIVVVLHAFSLNQRNEIVKKLLDENSQQLSYNK